MNTITIKNKKKILYNMIDVVERHKKKNLVFIDYLMRFSVTWVQMSR